MIQEQIEEAQRTLEDVGLTEVGQAHPGLAAGGKEIK